MRHMYSHPGEYRKIFLANYLCIGFVPGGTYKTKYFANYFLPGYNYNYKQISREIAFACAPVSHGTKASTTITKMIA